MDEMIINSEKMLFCDYYKQWIMVYKEGADSTNHYAKILYGLSMA